ncbi:hypothetical protein CDD82_5968 [Ophiocordyceps australis]|uniref:Uncharacterized protein n=1 Tax=Ophiocordyceps australis TaxID=1399860 RepID=A0A2C5YY71_9HYPO|nr:hypothetical protein CDD82_5968 [Ophiocordyceps australis]
MVILVARSKLVPDFALTIHLLHLILTSLYARALPRHSMWWATMAASSGIAIALGLWGCRYRELQPVFFAERRSLPGPLASAPDADQDASFARAATRGRGRDGAGEYELLQLKHAP